MSEAHHDLQSFFTYVISVFERLDIPYMVVGGFAAISYGVPHLTVAVDVVADMRWEHVGAFLAAFPSPGYYVSEESVRDSLTRRYPFNVIESATAAKVDVVPLPGDTFTGMAFQRRQQVRYDTVGHAAAFIAPEDFVVAKLIAHHNTGSDKHLRDAQGVLIVQWGDLKLDLIRRMSRASDVLESFERILQAAGREVSDSLAPDAAE